MKNILLIIQREYLTRVKKKSFIVMTIVGPLLIALMYGGVIWAAISSTNQKSIQVLDDSNLFENKFKNSDDYLFSYTKGDLAKVKAEFPKSGNDALVFIPAEILEDTKGVKIFSDKGVTLELQNKVEGLIEKEIESIKLTEAGITRSVLESAKMNVKSETISIKDGNEKKSSAAAASAIGFICAFLIYMSVFIYGAQVMRGITEEKTSRIVEIIISSVKPFQLLIGKIVGVALVGLTQFGLWIVLSLGVLTLGGKLAAPLIEKSKSAVTQSQMANLPPEAQEMAKANMQEGMPTNLMPDFFSALETLPIATIIIAFLFYFVGGYLLYSALFGAVGAAVDSDTDSQQFMFPITIPIIAAFMIAQFVIRDPNSSLAFWTSMVPFTSPIIMMVRIPFGVPLWQIILSITLLIGGFIFTTWIAARIYRVGILMYGKKVTWKELGKWLFYKS